MMCFRVICNRTAKEMVHGEGYCTRHAHEERQHQNSGQNGNATRYREAVSALISTDAEILWSADDRPVALIFAGIRYLLVEDAPVTP
jgi:hypothetical protein